VKLELRYPATAEKAGDFAELAVEVVRRELGIELDFMPESLEEVDAQVEALRDEGLTGEDAAEALFVFGCYLGEVMVRRLSGEWIDTRRSALGRVCPWPMVVVVPGGSTWDPIGKIFKRLELGDSEYLPVFYAAAAASVAR
jgi:hypothetical protein